MSTKGYTLIEPTFWESLWPDQDLILQCLEYIRLNLPTIVPWTAGLEIELIAQCRHGGFGPALGIVCDDSKEIPVIDFAAIGKLEASIDEWVRTETTEVVMARARNVSAPTWVQFKALNGGTN
ncbi:hypothetical protein [Pedosphaera parvula]|uniref:Uncharacterized protein n=1 Tax=Pedosphaera parvula (strain Ellin514) TaxID=320771 RepID=B9XFV4_PEDPL|nr:hypothetical protein [Pedosphaera parvula]EEF61116.1 hypothetical protein Cflav_PD3833 [Pedosphaera parvula Ellin514]